MSDLIHDDDLAWAAQIAQDHPHFHYMWVTHGLPAPTGTDPVPHAPQMHGDYVLVRYPKNFAWADPRGFYGRPATMLEEVAFATCSMQPCICRNKARFEGTPCLDRARRGVSRMREPTEEMLNAGYSGAHDSNLKPTWQAMIDAILK